MQEFVPSFESEIAVPYQLAEGGSVRLKMRPLAASEFLKAQRLRKECEDEQLSAIDFAIYTCSCVVVDASVDDVADWPLSFIDAVMKAAVDNGLMGAPEKKA